MASFCAVPTSNLYKSPQQQPASLACLMKPPGPSHMSFCIMHPGKSHCWNLAGMGTRRTPQGVALVGGVAQAAQGCC